MNSVKRTLFTILTCWLALFIIISISSHSILRVGFDELEFVVAKKNNERTSNSVLQNLNPILGLTATIAIGLDALLVLTAPKNRREYFEANLFNADLYFDNKVNYIAVFNSHNKLVKAQYYDLNKDEVVPISEKVVAQFKQIVKDYGDNKIKPLLKLGNTIGGLMVVGNKRIFFGIQRVIGASAKYPVGTLIIAKEIDDKFVAHINKQLGFPISILPIQSLERIRKKSKEEVIISNNVYLEIVSPLLLSSYQVINDYQDKPAFVLKVDLSRKLHQQSKESTMYNLLLLVFYSFVGVISLITIVFLFFRKIERFTFSIERFVPKKSIDMLDKSSIVDVDLGNYAEQNVSVLFTDIRNFTTISEKLTPKDNFIFINKILAKLAPIISDKNGFIDKFIGDAIMANFYDKNSSADNAIEAAIKMVDILEDVNKDLEPHNLAMPVNIGVGINTGDVMLGIIGEGRRFECTIISDTVNTASRVESSTKLYQANILITDQTLKKLQSPDNYHIRFVDKIMMKGKTEPTAIYEVFDNNAKDLIDQKNQSKDIYLKAWQDFNEDQIEQAKQGFETCLQICPSDMAAKKLLELCHEKIVK